MLWLIHKYAKKSKHLSFIYLLDLQIQRGRLRKLSVLVDFYIVFYLTAAINLE